MPSITHASSFRLPAWYAVAAVLLLATPAFPQGWEFDARKIGLGGAAGEGSVAARLLADQRDYRVIVLPFGLFQVLRDLDIFDPRSDEFDLARSIEYASSPLHYVIGRDREASRSGREFVVDVRNATLSRDLNAYRGFAPANQPDAEGLASPTWGRTIALTGDTASRHGLFLGAGPYLSMRTAVAIDDQLTEILESDTDVYFPNARLELGNDTRGQAALALTAGYRGRFAAGSGSDRDGVYAAVDYHYLRGFRYEDAAVRLRLDTDPAGLLTFRSLSSAFPLSVTRRHSTSGHGFAIDVGVAALINGWEAGIGINGIANRITWSDVRQRTYGLPNLFGGNNRFSQPLDLTLADEVRVELPVDYRLHGGYHSDAWSALVEYGHGFQDDTFRGGFEYRTGVIDLRGGGFYLREQWQPTGGIGFHFGSRVALDVALFGTSANASRERRAAIAASLRFTSP